MPTRRPETNERWIRNIGIAFLLITTLFLKLGSGAWIGLTLSGGAWIGMQLLSGRPVTFLPQQMRR